MVSDHIFRVGRPDSYDWGTIFDGKARELVEGEDFEVSTSSFRSCVYKKALSMGFKVKTSKTEEGLIVQKL